MDAYSRVRVIPGGLGFGGLAELFDEMFFSLGGAVSQLPQGLVCGEFPPTNIMADKDDNLIIQMSVAGYPDDGVDITYKDEYIVVTLTPDEHLLDDYNVKMQGLKNSKAQKKVFAPQKDFDVTAASAVTKNGIITITVPRKPEAKPQTIPISKG